MNTSNDIHYMKHALALAWRGVGHAWPNPSVGCVIVKNDRVIGRGRTAKGGCPHAETVALKQAGAQARGATVYVTLEPCAHHGKTPPCAQALIDAGVARVVIGCIDPDLRVAGRGVSMLQVAAIKVVHGICEGDALSVHSGFMSRITKGKPLITLKIATTRDGFTTLPEGQGRWITGERARAHTHLERSKHDAILAGVGTALADNPALNARVPGLAHDTVRVVLDSHLRIPTQSSLVQSTSKHPLMVFYQPNQGAEMASELRKAGAEPTPTDPHDLSSAMEKLAERGINRVLVEGGATVMRSFLDAGLWDQILWYRAPISVGQSMSEAVMPLDIKAFKALYGLHLIKTRVLGQDTLEIYRKAQ